MDNTKWWGGRELGTLRAHLAELVEHALLPPGPRLGTPDAARFDPPADMWETDDEIVVEVELPGVNAAEVELSLHESTLVIAGRAGAAPEGGATFQRVERPRGRFNRSLPVPVEVGGEARAHLRRGILEVRLGKAPGARRRVVPLREET